MDREKVIKGMQLLYDRLLDAAKRDAIAMLDALVVKNALAMLKEQEQIKSPDEFKSLLLGMFDSIWDVEIDHPIFQDTVGELMEGVLQAYRQAVKWDD